MPSLPLLMFAEERVLALFFGFLVVFVFLVLGTRMRSPKRRAASIRRRRDAVSDIPRHRPKKPRRVNAYAAPRRRQRRPKRYRESPAGLMTGIAFCVVIGAVFYTMWGWKMTAVFAAIGIGVFMALCRSRRRRTPPPELPLTPYDSVFR